jgi:hypothetical protein
MSTVNIPITGDATSLVAATQKANAALNTIGVAADKASAKIAPAMSSLSGGAQKAAAALGPLGGVLSKISPEAGSAASSIAGLASAGQGLAAAGTAAGVSMVAMAAVLGPVAIAVAALAAAYYVLDQNLQAVEEQNRIAAERAEDATKRFIDQKAVIKEIGDAYAVAAGNQSAADLKAIALKEKLQAAFAVDLANAQTALNYAKKQAQNTGAGSDADKARIRAEEGLASINDRMEMQNALIDQTIRLDEKKASSAKGVNEADKRSADAARAQKEAINAVATAQTALASITHDSSVSNLDALGKEADAYQIKLDRIYELTAAALANAKVAGLGDTKILAESLAAQEAVEKEHAENVAKIKATAAEKEQKEYEDRIAKLDALNVQAAEKALSDAETAFTAQLSVAEGYYAAAGKLSGLLTEATSKDFDTSTEAGKDAAIKQFNTQKAVAVALSIAQGALAVVQAIGSAPPPFNIPAIVATGIAVTAETATIAAQQPKFHAGTTGFRPDEGGATLQRGEGVVTSAGMSKPGMKETVAAANSGRTPGGNGGSMNMVYQHKVYNEFIRDNLKAGSPLTRRIDSGTKVGHRQSRS